MPVTISLAASHIGDVFTVSFTPPNTHNLGARTEFKLTVTKATLQAVRPASPTVATEGGAAVELMWRRIGGGRSGGTDYDPIAAPVQFRITNPDTGQERSGWIVTGAATDPPGNCGSIPSNLQFVRCDNSVAWTAALVNYVVGVRVTADLLNEESDYQLTMALEDNPLNSNFDSARYEISDFPYSAVEWVAENVDVVVTPLAALNSDLRAVLAEGGALLPVTLSIAINSPGELPVVFNFQGAEFNEVAVYTSPTPVEIDPDGSGNYRATIGDDERFTVVQVSAIINVDLADELWNLRVSLPTGSGSLPITVASAVGSDGTSDLVVIQLVGNVGAENADVPASAVFPEHRGEILLTIRTFLRDRELTSAASVPLLIQPGETVEFSFLGTAPTEISVAGIVDPACTSECLIRLQNTVAIAVSTLTVTLTPVPNFVDEGNEAFNYQIGDLRSGELSPADRNIEDPIYRLQLTDPPVGDFDSQNIEAAINTQILITVSFEGPAADVADVRAELRLHFRGANVANASASGVVDFRRNTPDLECTTVGVPSGVTSMCDLNSTFALDGGNGDAVITLVADVNLDREVRVSLFNRRVENSPRDDDLLFRDNEARIIFSPLLVHTGAASPAEGAEGGDAFIIGTVTVGVPSTARSEIVNVTLSVGLSAATGRHPSDFSLLRGTTQTLDVIPSSDDTAILFLLPIGINDTAITIRATAVADLANVPISIEGGEGSEAFTVSVVTDAAVGITPGGATFSLPFTVTPGPAVIRFADTSPLRFFEGESGFINIEGRVPLESGDTFRLSYAQPGSGSTGATRTVDRIIYTRATDGPLSLDTPGDFQIPLLENSGRGCSPQPSFPCFAVTLTGPLDVIALSVTVHQDGIPDDEFFVFRLLPREDETVVEDADDTPRDFVDTDILLRDAITVYSVVVSGGTDNVINILHNEIAEVTVGLDPPRARRSLTNAAVNFRIVASPGSGDFATTGEDFRNDILGNPTATFAIDEFGPIVLRVNPNPTASGQDIILQAEIISPDSGTPSYTAVGAVTISVRRVEIGVVGQGLQITESTEATPTAATLTIAVASPSGGAFHPRFQVEPASLAAEFNVNYGGQTVPPDAGFYSGATIVVEADQPTRFNAVDDREYPVTISSIADGVYEAPRTAEFAIAAAIVEADGTTEYQAVGVQEQPTASRTALTLTLTDELPTVRFTVNVSNEALNVSVSEGNVVTLSVFSNLTIAADPVSISFSISGASAESTNAEAIVEGATCRATAANARRCSLVVSDLPTDLAGLTDATLQGRIIQLTFISRADTDDGVAHTNERFALELLDSTAGHAVANISVRTINVDVFEPNPIAFAAAASGNLPWGSPSGFSPVIIFEPGENNQPQISVRIVGPATGSTAALIDPNNVGDGGDIFITNAVSCDVAAASCIFNAPAISVSGGETVASNLTIGISVAASALSVISATEGITLSLNTAALDALGYRQNPLANVFALQPTAATLSIVGDGSAIAEGAVAVVTIIADRQVAADGEPIYIKAPNYGADYLFILDNGTPDGTPLDADSECSVQTSDQTAGGTPVRDGLLTVSICRLPASAGTPVGDDPQNIQLPFTVSVIFDFTIEEAEALTLALANANEIPRSLLDTATSPPYPYAPVTGSGSEYALTFSNTAFDIGFQLVGDASQSGTLREGQTGQYMIGPLSPTEADLASLSGTISGNVRRAGTVPVPITSTANPADIDFGDFEGCPVAADGLSFSCLVDFDPDIGAAVISIRALSDRLDDEGDAYLVQVRDDLPGYTVPANYPEGGSLIPQIITVDIVDGASYRLEASSAGTSGANTVSVPWGNRVTVSVLFEPSLVLDTLVTLNFPVVRGLQRNTAFSVVTPSDVEPSVFTLNCEGATPGATPSACFLRANLAASADIPVSSAALTLSLNAEAGGQDLVFTITDNLGDLGDVVPDSAADEILISVLTPQAGLATPDYGVARAEGESFISGAGAPLLIILDSAAVEDITVGFRATGSQCIGCDAAISDYGDFDIFRTADTAGECFPLADDRSSFWVTGGINAPTMAFVRSSFRRERREFL